MIQTSSSGIFFKACLFTLALTTAGVGCQAPPDAKPGDLVVQPVNPDFQPADPSGSSQDPTAGDTVKAGTSPESVNLTETVDRISAPIVESDLKELSGAVPAKISTGAVTIAERKSSTGRSNAKRWIREKMESFGLKTSEYPFTSSGGLTGVNVEGVLAGEAKGRHLYVTAHYDTVNTAGANDDGSGTVAVLAAARALSQTHPRDWVHFVTFDLEEAGLLGSSAYVKAKVLPLFKQNKSQVLGNLHSDMVAYNPGKNRIAITDCKTAPDLVGAAMDGLKEAQINLIAYTGCAGRSDNVSFSSQGIPAVFFIDETYFSSYPWYHTKGDTIDKVDTGFLARVSQTLTAAIIKLAYVK